MICPDCTGRMDVLRTFPDKKLLMTIRELQCLGCGVRKTSVETYATENYDHDITKHMRKRKKLYARNRVKRETKEADIMARRALHDLIPTTFKKKPKEPKS